VWRPLDEEQLMKHARALAAAGLVVTTVALLSGCSGGPARSADSIKVVYLDDGNAAMTTYMNQVTKDFKAAHKGTKVDLQPVKASESDFYTKIALMNRSASTAPDVIWEDTFQVKADASAGYLEPLDGYLKKWSDWPQFIKAGRAGGQGADGKQYGVPVGTDTQGLWYSKALLTKAGISLPWQPKTWQDVLSTARQIKAKVPGVTPINVYASKVGAEATSVRGVQTLLSGTGDSIYQDGKWVTSSPGLTSTLSFIKSIYGEKLGPANQTTSDPNYGNIPPEMLKKGTLAIDGDGSWISSNWTAGGSSPWPDWSKDLGVAAWPTQNGDGTGTTSMSGGWTFAMGSKSAAKQLAFDYISTATDKTNALRYAIGLSNIPVRSDVAADASYAKSNPTAEFFSSLVKVTHFRPAIAAYPQVSNQLAIAADTVSTNGQSVDSATKAYGAAVQQVVGADKTTTESQ
jgi:multiple sugar transport system substrate-binding protein